MIPKSTNSFGQNMGRILLMTVGILLIPFIAMQFSEGVDWNAFDFIIVAILLIGSGTIYELLSRWTGKRVIIGVITAIMVFLIWAELAVGIFGTPFAGS